MTETVPVSPRIAAVQMGNYQISLTAHSLHRFTWQMQPTLLRRSSPPACIDPSPSRIDLNTIIQQPGKLE